MAISLHTAGTWAYDASGSVTVTLPTHSAGDMLIVRVAMKSGSMASVVASMATSGWAKVGQKNGSGNSGNGTGGVMVAAEVKGNAIIMAQTQYVVTDLDDMGSAEGNAVRHALLPLLEEK